MKFEQLKRNKKAEHARVMNANEPKSKYHQTRQQHVREIVRLFKEIRRQVLLIKLARLTYRLEK